MSEAAALRTLCCQLRAAAKNVENAMASGNCRYLSGWEADVIKDADVIFRLALGEDTDKKVIDRALILDSLLGVGSDVMADVPHERLQALP